MTKDYQDYVSDQAFLSRYHEFQNRFSTVLRENERAVIDLVGAQVKNKSWAGDDCRLLDIGCSTGNLLLHMRRHFPSLALVGADLAASSVEQARRDSKLAGIEFAVMDVTALGKPSAFEIITVNKVLYLLSKEQYRKALASLYDTLVPGGVVIVCDFVHAYEQYLTVVEESASHPDGLPLHFRPRSFVAQALRERGFADIGFQPFEIGIDLPRDPDVPENINTHTVRIEGGKHLQFRGALAQPWCFYWAKRPLVDGVAT